MMRQVKSHRRARRLLRVASFAMPALGVAAFVTTLATALCAAGCSCAGGPPDPGGELMDKMMEGSLGFGVDQSVTLRAQDVFVNHGRWPDDAKAFFALGPVGLRYYKDRRLVWDGIGASEVGGFRSEATRDGRRYRLTWRGHTYVVDADKPDSGLVDVMRGRELERQRGGAHSPFGPACRDACYLSIVLIECAGEGDAARMPAYDSETNSQVVDEWYSRRPSFHPFLSRDKRSWSYSVPPNVVGRSPFRLPEDQVILTVTGCEPLEGVTNDCRLVFGIPVNGGPKRKRVLLYTWFDYDGLG